MSALPFIATANPPPAGVKWIALPLAARRLGISERRARQRCASEWLAVGLAAMIRPDQGGKAIWHLREDADARLGRVVFPDAIGFDLRTLTEKQRKVASDRLRILKQWKIERSAGVTLGLNERKITSNFIDRLFIDENRKLGRSTLFDWDADYRRHGIAGPIDDRRQDKTGGDASDLFLQEIKRRYLNLRRPKLTVCYEIACLKADENGWSKRSYKTAQRFISSIDRPTLLKLRMGDEAYTNEAEPFIERDYASLSSNQIWCGDHHQCDVIVSSGGKFVRPWLTAWQDVRSRKIIGWCIFAHDPNQDTILQAFRSGALEFGVPEKVYVDNGKDYDSFALNGKTKFQRRRWRLTFDGEHVAGVFTQLGVSVTHCQPYHGQSKPIERFFGTLEDRFGRTFETYCGRSPAHKPENLQSNLDSGKAPTLEEFRDSFGEWLERDYHTREHAGDGMSGRSPDQVYAEYLASKRTAAPELIDFLCLKPQPPVKVGQNGVTYRGIRYGQFEPALHRLIGAQVVLRIDPNDVSRVIVCAIDGKFICIADSNSRMLFDSNEQILRTAIGDKKRMRRVLSDYREVRPRLHEDLTDLMIRAAAARNRAARTDRPDPTLPPPSLNPIRSPLEKQLPAIQQSMGRRRFKQAVGAENAHDDTFDISQTLADAVHNPNIFPAFNYTSNQTADEEISSLGSISEYLKSREAANE